MSKKQKVMGCLLLSIMMLLMSVSEHITNGMIQRAYKPYKGVLMVLDAGHGGKDAGAQRSGVDEKELNLTITKKLKKSLEKLGMKVILTRSGDADLASPTAKLRKREDMKNRVAIINQKKVDMFMSIHMNVFPNESVQGSQLFYDAKDKDSLLFAQSLQNSIQKVSSSLKEIKTGDYYILKNAQKIGVLLECGFISNAEDRNQLLDVNYQNRFVDAIRKGIVDFMKQVYE